MSEITSLRKKIGQIMMIGFHGDKLNSEVIDMISNCMVGSVILFSRNIKTPEQVKLLTRKLQETAKQSGHYRPLIIATDQENGIVRRLNYGFTKLPGSMVLGAVDDCNTTYEISKTTGKELKSAGINMNLAPVMDVNSNPKNPVIGVRSFGENPSFVASHGVEFIKGHQSQHVITSAKHFPGHGDTAQDSHLGIPLVNNSMENVRKTELVPFIAAIQNNVASVMISHVHYRSIDMNQTTPASLSKNVINHLLRGKFGFRGVVITDCLEMDAISSATGTAEGALNALKAGVDLLVVSHTYAEQKRVIDRIVDAVNHNEIELQVIDNAVERIHKLKDKYINWNFINKNSGGYQLSEQDFSLHRKLARSVYRRGITVLKGKKLLPIDSGHIHCVTVFDNNGSPAEENSDCIDLKRLNIPLDIRISTGRITGSETDQELEKKLNGDADFSVIFTNTTGANNNLINKIHYLIDRLKTTALISLKSPYILSEFPKAQVLIATYDPTETAIQAVMEIITGKVQAVGKSPVTI
ncbi:beta-N-acetylhexosaminidase [Virgibacillus siamensis]|uniref:Beta-N-acetylhexosaminidase n=1 Tax=Virgibacillus siamensis TaxID=480071 RepID=A0ABN1FG74_9BACI